MDDMKISRNNGHFMQGKPLWQISKHIICICFSEKLKSLSGGGGGGGGWFFVCFFFIVCVLCK